MLFNYEHFRDRRTVDRGVPSVGGFQFSAVIDYPGYPLPTPIDGLLRRRQSSVVSGELLGRFDLNRAALVLDHTTEFGLNIRNQFV